MPRTYLVKIYKVKSVAEIITIASNKRQAIRKIRDVKLPGNKRKLKFEKPISNPIYLAFERNDKMER